MSIGQPGCFLITAKTNYSKQWMSAMHLTMAKTSIENDWPWPIFSRSVGQIMFNIILPPWPLFIKQLNLPILCFMSPAHHDTLQKLKAIDCDLFACQIHDSTAYWDEVKANTYQWLYLILLNGKLICNPVTVQSNAGSIILLLL